MLDKPHIRWSKLNVGDYVSDSTCALVPDHFGVVTETDNADKFDRFDTKITVEFYSGDVRILNRSKLGPEKRLDILVYPPEPTHNFWCYACKIKITPKLFYYNSFGLVRARCPHCNSYGAIGSIYA